AEALGIKVVQPAERPTLDADLEAQRVDAPATVPPAMLPDAPISIDVSVEDTALVRGVGVFEHRQLLEQALTSARRRLLIISPWVKAAVVDTTFMMRLE